MTARLVILISGSGTNLQATLDAISSGELDAEVVLVVSNRKVAYGLVRAEEAGIPTLYFPLKPYTDTGRVAYDHDLAKQVKGYAPDLIVLAGWMHILSPAFLDWFPKKVINLHPALPGQFPGIDAIQRTFESYQHGEIQVGGCMVHYVIPEIDAGAVIATRTVTIEPGDTLEAFEVRMHQTEHILLVSAIRTILNSQAL
jgi:formyltetrahydrofolate-dependent phosphoribosylglycinamide formyltransferase